MKKILGILSVLIALSFAHSLQAEKRGTIKVDLFDDNKELSNSELRRKVRRLQDAVIDLQDRLDRVEDKLGGATTNTSSGSVTCYIETPFDGMFDATEANETKSRVEAVKACMTKVKSRIHCSAEKVKCGR